MKNILKKLLLHLISRGRETVGAPPANKWSITWGPKREKKVCLCNHLNYGIQRSEMEGSCLLSLASSSFQKICNDYLLFLPLFYSLSLSLSLSLYIYIYIYIMLFPLVILYVSSKNI